MSNVYDITNKNVEYKLSEDLLVRFLLRYSGTTNTVQKLRRELHCLVVLLPSSDQTGMMRMISGDQDA